MRRFVLVIVAVLATAALAVLAALAASPHFKRGKGVTPGLLNRAAGTAEGARNLAPSAAQRSAPADVDGRSASDYEAVNEPSWPWRGHIRLGAGSRNWQARRLAI